ncbi:MAG: L-threonylcarbamoyladenylate synthase [Defluviitaleaceae bacterium]|nr:L-threonylcarbamoyladenylate synthase [Defluviitaleaceae bacterium]
MRTVLKHSSTPDAIEQAARIIKDGGLVAFPTETVYGLGGNALCSAACAKIYAAKGRPSDNPLISHISDAAQLAELVSHVPAKAQKLIDAFWPGPLTIIFPCKNTPGQTIGIRMPQNPVALALITHAGVPIAAPSANISGRPSPTTAAHVLTDLDGKVDMILDGGMCQHGLESTVIDCTVEPPTILRPGSVTKEMIEAHIGPVNVTTEAGADEAPKAPGMKYKHYAPQAVLTVVRGRAEDVRTAITRLAKDSTAKSVGIMATSSYEGFTTLLMGNTTEEIAAGLFALLRKCDEMGLAEVFVEGVDEAGLGAAIMNRLEKAAAYNIVEV